jgi:hypothetical protein
MRASNGTIHSATQFSVFLASKPAQLAQICQRLADDKINIVAMSMMDASEHGVLRVVAADTDRAREALTHLDASTAETTVLLATLPNRPGALADVVERLAVHHIAVEYAYCTTGARNGKTTGVFRVSDIGKATQVLAERQPRRKSQTSAVRKQVGSRRRR